MADEDQQPSTEAPPPGPEAPTADLGALAQATASASESAVVRPTAAAGDSPPPGPGAGLVDIYGRPASPDLHLRNKKGVYATTPRSGKLICLKGQNLGRDQVQRMAPAPGPAPAGDFLDVGAAGVDPLAQPAPGTAPSPAAGQQVQVEQLPPMVTPESAAMDGEAITDGIEMLGQFAAAAAGAMQPTERAVIEKRWSNVMLKYQLTIPFGQLVLAAVATGKYGYRVAKTEEGRETLADLWATLTGQPAKRKTVTIEQRKETPIPGNNPPPQPSKASGEGLSEKFGI